MRIAMVSLHASPLVVPGGADAGGQNVYVAALAHELGRRGHAVVVHTRREQPSFPRRIPFAGQGWVDHVDAGPSHPLPKDDLWRHVDSAAADLRRQWRRDRPDVVHAHFWMSGIAALTAARPLGIPVAQTFHALGVVKRRHQGPADTSPPDRLDAERRIIRQADRIIATCSDEAFELRQLGVDLGRVSIVPCGVNLSNFTPDGAALPASGRFRHRLVVVGRLVRRKGVDDVIRALSTVPHTELLVVGGPPADELDGDPDVQRLSSAAARLGVRDRVRFLGARPRAGIPPVLRSAAAVVTVPWYEPFGLVALEAMACGVPVVAAAVGGMVDTVVDDVTGVHVPPRDPAALARSLRSLLADPARRARLGRNGVQRARRHYGWRRVADGVYSAYRATLPTRRPQPRPRTVSR